MISGSISGKRSNVSPSLFRSNRFTISGIPPSLAIQYSYVTVVMQSASSHATSVILPNLSLRYRSTSPDVLISKVCSRSPSVLNTEQLISSGSSESLVIVTRSPDTTFWEKRRFSFMSEHVTRTDSSLLGRVPSSEQDPP